MNYFYFSVILLFGIYFRRTQTACPQPDLPTDGRYTPRQKKFDLGDEITYSCEKGFVLAGKDKRICKSYGAWSDYTPFCDRSINLSDPSISNNGDIPPTISRVIDGVSKTCFEWHNATEEHLYLHLDTEIVVRTVKIFLKKGITKLQIFTGLNNNMKICAEYHNFIETDRWIQVECESSVLADTMKIFVPQNKQLSICEIQVYGKEEDGCNYPPTAIVPFGHFEVSRTRASLVCEDGYKSQSSRLVCVRNSTWSRAGLRCDEILCDPVSPTRLSGGKWTFPVNTQKISIGTKSELKCDSGYRKAGYPEVVVCLKNGTWTETNATCVVETKNTTPSTRVIIFASIGVVIVIIIVALLATTIHYIKKQRNKEVMVVYQSPSDGSFPLSESEMEYSSPRYEPLLPKPEPPSTPRPVPANFATIVKGTSKEKTEEWNKNFIDHPPPPNMVFSSMKPSTIYGS